jgi:hypothetical protein
LEAVQRSVRVYGEGIRWSGWRGLNWPDPNCRQAEVAVELCLVVMVVVVM